MKMNNNGFTLIELLAVIVVLAIVSVIGTVTVLPAISSVREDAFRVGATNAIKSARSAIDLVNLGERSFTNDGSNCRIGNTVCFTIDALIEWGTNDGSVGTYKGKIVADITNFSNPTYTVYFKKNAEYAFIGASGSTADDFDLASSADWSSEYETCTCTE